MLVSIITATYNSAHTIEQCIGSIIAQRYKSVEYIIIDNCSSDNTIDIVRSYNEEISRIVSEPDNGIFDALNKGILLAQGEIIGFLHADDFYASENVIENVVNKFLQTGADAVYGDLQYVAKANTDKVVRNWVAGEFSERKLKNGWMPPHPSLFIKRNCYKKFGLFDTSFKIAADYELFLRFFKNNKVTITYLPQVLVKMRTGGTSNKNIMNLFRKSSEDLRAMKLHKTGNFFTLLQKNFRKVGQFI